MRHLGFVLAAYGVTGVVLALTVAWVLIDQRLRRNELKRLEAAGVRRSAVRVEKAGKAGETP
ncbi:MAG: heme exporter protein CcmD [Rhizobiales bacterium]|nr:heme exporter protein CcmD [Hyphomicrobiales bacterium]OJY06901.1 MAG: heme exporter protein CcmD [Rhizobiales bacterium 63-22]